MGIFMLSDVIIASTLLINSIAVMSSKFYYEYKSVDTTTSSNNNNIIINKTISHTSNSYENINETTLQATIKCEQQHVIPSDNISSNTSTLSRVYVIINGIRKLSGVIVIWNIFFGILMLFVFRS